MKRANVLPYWDRHQWIMSCKWLYMYVPDRDIDSVVVAVSLLAGHLKGRGFEVKGWLQLFSWFHIVRDDHLRTKQNKFRSSSSGHKIRRLTLSLPHSPICTSVNVPRLPICTVIHTPMVHSYCSMKRLPLFLVALSACVINMPFWNFPYNLQVKRYSELNIVQWNLFITRSLGPWKLPCYIRFLIISG